MENMVSEQIIGCQLSPEAIKNMAKDISEDIIRWRRTLHACPEIQMNTVETEKFIVQTLKEIGIQEIRSGVGGHGVVAVIRGKHPGKVLAIRADCDGLPVKEESGLPFASTNGNSHVCGHDAHTAMALGAAKIIFANKEHLKGCVKFIFQPFEEGGQGAKALVADGALENPHVDAIIGLHTGRLWTTFKPGQVGYRYGYMNATSDKFFITFYGKGGHASTPHETIDPIVMASHAVVQIQTIISREKNPITPGVISITKIVGGHNHNAIPNQCEISGTIRSQGEKERTFFQTRLQEICQMVAHGMRGNVKIDFIYGSPVMKNNSQLTDIVRATAVSILGEDSVLEIEESGMFGEDMGIYFQYVPGVYFFHSSCFGDDRDYPHHHPKFDVNEDTFWIGSAIFAKFALDWQQN